MSGELQIGVHRLVPMMLDEPHGRSYDRRHSGGVTPIRRTMPRRLESG
jgi:hypothetical protein